MIKRKESMTTDIKPNLRGGSGELPFLNIFTQEELPKTRLFSVVTLQPGDSIGVHPHDTEGEVYLILEGQATVTEDGVDYLLNPGDAEYCTGGHTHAAVNNSDGPVVFLAIVIL